MPLRHPSVTLVRPQVITQAARLNKLLQGQVVAAQVIRDLPPEQEAHSLRTTTSHVRGAAVAIDEDWSRCVRCVLSEAYTIAYCIIRRTACTAAGF